MNEFENHVPNPLPPEPPVPPGQVPGPPGQEPGPPEKKEKGGLGGARQTLYRVTARNQLRSVAIADGKANILIGINTILISIIIAVLGAESSIMGLGFLSEPDLFFPMVLFLLACLFSVTMAVYAVRPMKKAWSSKAPKKLMFKDVREISLEDYQQYMSEIMKSGENVYEALNTDMWLMSHGIVRKFNYLRWAYTVFLIGLAGMVTLFLAIRLLT